MCAVSLPTSTPTPFAVTSKHDFAKWHPLLKHWALLNDSDVNMNWASCIIRLCSKHCNSGNQMMILSNSHNCIAHVEWFFYRRSIHAVLVALRDCIHLTVVVGQTCSAAQAQITGIAILGNTWRCEGWWNVFQLILRSIILTCTI